MYTLLPLPPPGDISIDDVSFGECEPPVIGDRACTDTEFRCNNEYCIEKQYVCDYADHCGDSSDEKVSHADITNPIGKSGL